MSMHRLVARLAAATGLVALALGAPGASAATQMFKCIIGTRTVYQQQACPVEAQPAQAASAASSVAARPASAVANAAATRKLRPASHHASASATPR
jgi:hypothetical protein